MPQASSFDSILEQCRDLVNERVSDALTGMLDEAEEALTALGRQSHDPETSRLYELTRNKVLSQREAIVAQFRMRFLREFQERGNRVKKIGDRLAEIDLSSLEQEPVAEDDLNGSLKFNAMASRLRQYCDEELLALDQRVGVLIGDADLQSEDNPFTPQAIVDAYRHTCRQIDPSVDVQMVLLKLFDDYVLDEIRGVYKAVNALLVENSILPKIRLPGAREREGTKAPSAEAARLGQGPGNVSMAAMADNMPQELTNTNLGGGMTQMDTMTLDMMAILFDDLFDDRKIPTAVKGLIGRLQAPMFKLAIADKAFVSRKNHPARQLLAELGEFSAQLPADISESDPTCRKLDSILQSVIEAFEDDVKEFDDVRQQLGTLIVEVNEGAEQKTQPVENQVSQEEKLALAKTAAEAQIKARVRADAPQLILKFLVKQWGKVLVVIHVREGETSEAWKGALETADVLLWSGEPKETIEERQKMVGAVPGLLKRISSGLSYAGIDDNVRVKFFADLRKLHATIIGRLPQTGVAAPGKESVADHGSVEAERDVASGELDAAKETGANDSVTDSETAAGIAEPGEAESSDSAGQPDALSMKDDPAEPDSGESIRLDFLPSKGKAAKAAKLADTATAKSATQAQNVVSEKAVVQEAGPDDTGEDADSVPPLEFETGLLKTGEQVAAPDDAKPFADPVPPLEFEASLPEPGEQDAAPVDIEAIVNSLPSLEFEAEAENSCEHNAGAADTTSGAQPPPEQTADPSSAQAEVHEAADRMLKEEPEPVLMKSTTRMVEEPPAQLRAEMDKAMEATRTMFSDVDRFIILGQIRNATNLLESRIKHEPGDRDSWIKLMAIYRDEGMEGGFNRTYSAFCEQFGTSVGA